MILWSKFIFFTGFLIQFLPILLMNIKIRFLFGLLLWVFTHLVEGQTQPHLGQTDRLMKDALTAMESRDFDKANQVFRQIIDSNIPIPQEMPYFFAETLFELKQYDNSANFLNKYLEINGFKGDNYEHAKELEERLKSPLNEIKSCHLCDRRGYRYKTCFTCEGSKEIEQDCNYCKAKGVIGCSRCAGSGLITKKNVFNIIEYFECERCAGKGRLTCPSCQGTKKEVGACKTCQGSGRLNSEIICDHKPVEETFIHQDTSHP